MHNATLKYGYIDQEAIARFSLLHNKSDLTKYMNEETIKIEQPQDIEPYSTSILRDSYVYKIYFHSLTKLIQQIVPDKTVMDGISVKKDLVTCILKTVLKRLFGTNRQGLASLTNLIIEPIGGMCIDELWDTVASNIVLVCSGDNSHSGLDKCDFFALQVLAGFARDEIGVMSFTAANNLFEVFALRFKNGKILCTNEIEYTIETWLAKNYGSFLSYYDNA